MKHCDAGRREVVDVGEPVEGASLESVVPVIDIDRQEPPDVGPVDDAAPSVCRRPDLMDDELARLPASDRVHEPEPRRVPFLTDEMHLVPEPHQSVGELGVVHVRPGPPQKVAVEDQDAHGDQDIGG